MKNWAAGHPALLPPFGLAEWLFSSIKFRQTSVVSVITIRGRHAICPLLSEKSSNPAMSTETKWSETATHGGTISKISDSVLDHVGRTPLVRCFTRRP